MAEIRKDVPQREDEGPLSVLPATRLLYMGLQFAQDRCMHDKAPAADPLVAEADHA